MGIFELFGKRAMPMNEAMYDLKAEMHPFKLNAHKNDYVDMEIDLTSQFNKELLTSVVVVLPKAIGFEQSALSHQKEIRLGVLQPGERKHLKVQIFGTQRTEQGSYPVYLFAISHYRDYSYIINEVKKKLELRVV